jgi:hypothetical protein
MRFTLPVNQKQSPETALWSIALMLSEIAIQMHEISEPMSDAAMALDTIKNDLARLAAQGKE